MGLIFLSPMHASNPTLKMIDRCVVKPFYGIGLKVLLTIFLMWDSERLDETGSFIFGGKAGVHQELLKSKYKYL